MTTNPAGNLHLQRLAYATTDEQARVIVATACDDGADLFAILEALNEWLVTRQQDVQQVTT